MFKRVILESWHESVPYVCFAFIAAAFLIIVVRALLMKRTEVDRVARLPLDEPPALPGGPGPENPETCARP